MPCYTILMTGGSAVVMLFGPVPPIPDTASMSFSMSLLSSGVPYFVRVACNNDVDDVIGTSVPSVPVSLAPQRPSIEWISTPGGVLTGGGGQSIVIYGTRLGRRGGDYNSLSTPHTLHPLSLLSALPAIHPTLLHPILHSAAGVLMACRS